ncbi:MAG: DUF4097 family beta strand repeat protein [Clostridia bacterium]|nr:DUF4097 family beta strand repeat protein [Clostridia bacterium]
MKRTLCILAVLLVIAGGVLMLATFPTMLAERKANDQYAVLSEDLKDRYDAVEIHAVNADVTVTNAGDGQPAVEAKTDPSVRITVESNGGTLVVKEVDQRKWYQKIGIFSPKPGKIEVRLANGIYSDLEVKSANSDITVKASPGTVSFERVTTNTVNGDTHIEIPVDWAMADSRNGNIRFAVCYDSHQVRGMTGIVSGKTTNGDIVDESVSAAKSFATGNGRITSTGRFGMLYAKTVNGDIELNSVLGDKVNAESVNGAIKAILLKPMNYVTSSKNGRVTVPKETGESPFVASTVNGDITIEIAAGIELLDD